MQRWGYLKVWRERARAGQIWNWTIWSTESFQGIHANDPPFNLISIVSSPRDGAAEITGNTAFQAAQVAFPSDTPKQLRTRLARANDVRNMVGFERWTVVDGTVDGNSSPPSQSLDSEASSLDSEWSKLIGTWKAPTNDDGGYRIKRISRGQEILEVYNRDDDLEWKTKVDMQIFRDHGLNFFSVSNRVQLYPPRDAPLESNSYTSIYKVHGGKWYEQLRGIFAENDSIAPDAFLIYERIED